jgi:hypothetical protein
MDDVVDGLLWLEVTKYLCTPYPRRGGVSGRGRRVMGPVRSGQGRYVHARLAAYIVLHPPINKASGWVSSSDVAVRQRPLPPWAKDRLV